MGSKYDSINTAAELVAEVQANGLSLMQEDICRAQDIFGRSAVKDLIALANDIGRGSRTRRAPGAMAGTKPEAPSISCFSKSGIGKMPFASGTSTVTPNTKRSWSSGPS